MFPKSLSPYGHHVLPIPIRFELVAILRLGLSGSSRLVLNVIVKSLEPEPTLQLLVEAVLLNLLLLMISVIRPFTATDSGAASVGIVYSATTNSLDSRYEVKIRLLVSIASFKVSMVCGCYTLSRGQLVLDKSKSNSHLLQRLQRHGPLFILQSKHVQQSLLF